MVIKYLLKKVTLFLLPNFLYFSQNLMSLMVGKTT